ncbi:MAG: DUF1461 domain-containing protein [Nanoarchaeota archaeon]|nr:DUF1461 domain-containing protein [Nanoarchaeota archaeon]
MSYKIILYLTPTTAAQENVFLFLEGKKALAAEFTELEASHLKDVKKVMDYADYILYVLLLGVTLVITYFWKKKDFVLKLLNDGGKAAIAAMIVVSAFSLLFFDLLFALFHKIFFPQGNWIFSPDSLIIQTFPLEFFMIISRNIFLVTLFLGILFILLGYYLDYVLRHRN